MFVQLSINVHTCGYNFILSILIGNVTVKKLEFNEQKMSENKHTFVNIPVHYS